MRTDAPLHRLWYDLRNQSLFEDALLHHLAGNDHAADDLAANVVRVLGTLAAAAP